MCVRLYAKPEKIIIFGFFKFCSLSLNVEKSTFCPRNLTGLANSYYVGIYADFRFHKV